MTPDPAKAFEQVVTAKADHDANCRYGGTAVEVHIHPESIAALGWEEGDVIAGLKVVADEKQRPKTLRVYCDVELGGGGLSEEEAEHIIDGGKITQPNWTPTGAPA